MDGLRELVREATARRDERMLAKRSQLGGESSVNLDVPKLEDAELAGGPRSSECTLIVTEGDSAKALAVAGLAVVGRQSYGVFPLRGKPLNVRDVSARRVGDNEELTGLMKARGRAPRGSYGGATSRARALKDGLGLAAAEAEIVGDARRSWEMHGAQLPRRQGEEDEAARPRQAGGGDSATGNGPWYGRPADGRSGLDGPHIKGLVISMLHHYWPELLAAGFVQEFQTPLLKARSCDGSLSPSTRCDRTPSGGSRSILESRSSGAQSTTRGWHVHRAGGEGVLAALESHRVQLEMETRRKRATHRHGLLQRAAERKDYARGHAARAARGREAADVEGAKGAAGGGGGGGSGRDGRDRREETEEASQGRGRRGGAAARLDAP